MQSDAVRLDWSRWSRCESSFNLLLTPHQPGIFALAEEIVDATVSGGKRMLAVLEVASAEDLSRTCHAHPTLSEAIKEAALAVDKRAIHV